MISFTCAKCQATLKVGDDKAGMKGKCPKCGQLLVVPAVAAVAAQPVAAPAAPQPQAAAPQENAAVAAVAPRPGCPKCGSKRYSFASGSERPMVDGPMGALMTIKDRICKDCGQQYSPPAPRWMPYAFVLIGLFLAGHSRSRSAR